MKVTNINLDRLLSLDAIDCEVNEGFIYRYNGMIAKLFATSLTDEDLEFIKNKMYSCSLLDRYKSLLPKEYVVASSALAVDGTELGITEEEIIGRTYKEIFNDETIPLEKKIKMLKKVGKLFNDMDVIRTNGLENLHIGDVHSGNFMLDRFGNLKVVDTDSSTIFDSPAYPAKYLCEGSIARMKPTYAVASITIYLANLYAIPASISPAITPTIIPTNPVPKKLVTIVNPAMNPIIYSLIDVSSKLKKANINPPRTVIKNKIFGSIPVINTGNSVLTNK